MKNFVLISLFALILTACKDPNLSAEGKTTTELLVAHGWQLDKYTNTQGTRITDGQLKSEATMLYGLAFQFKEKEVWGIDKSTKGIMKRGVWSIDDDEKILAVNVEGFVDDFEVVEINNTSMILKAKTEKYLDDVGDEIHLVFSEFKL